MSKQLPPRPDLDQLKKQAKELLKAHQAASPEAAEAIKEHFPRLADSSEAEILRAEFTLQNAQHVVAREYGFAGWDELSAAIAPLDEQAPQLNDREIQVLVTQLDKKDLAFYLWSADAEVREKVLSKTTEYLRNFVEDEVWFLGPVEPWFRPGGDAAEPIITSFDDLVNLADAEIQTTLREIDKDDLVTALTKAGEPVREKILANIGGRVRAIIREEIGSRGEISPDEMTRAQAVFLAEAEQGAERHRDKVRSRMEEVGERVGKARQAATQPASHEQEMGELRNLLVDCARLARRDGIHSLRSRDDLPEMVETVVELICSPEADKARCIMQAMLLIMAGTAPDEVEEALRREMK
jgi:hypothetical protein